ncbi:MAG TPA: DNA-formamidopyrimidine glycosylase family protein [Edaphobacter sp.]|nr:DNA-formamidopyrimidine glycosylase family protein [Edaphobacter sp.]
MPEGDTIYRSARALQRAIGGKVVTGFETALAKIASVDDNTPITGRTITTVESRGKWLLIQFSGDLILATHMLMSGSWHLYRTGERWQMPRSRMRIVITTSEWQAVAFNVPVAEFYTARTLERSSQIPKLGPDILSADFTLQQGVERMKEYTLKSPSAEVGNTLLNQRVLAGLGNVYKSEVAFSAGVHPFRTVSTLTATEIERLVEFAHRYMKANVIDGKGDGIVTYSGNRRTTHATDRRERLWVYGRQHQECRRCGATILMRRQGTGARSTYWCPDCQPWRD